MSTGSRPRASSGGMPDPADRRVRRLELTPAGAELHARMMEEAIRLQAVVMAGLGDDEKAALGVRSRPSRRTSRR